MNFSNNRLVKGLENYRVSNPWLSLFLPIIFQFVVLIPLTIVTAIFLLIADQSYLNSAVERILITGIVIGIYFLYVKFIEKRPVGTLGFEINKGIFLKYGRGCIVAAGSIVIIVIIMKLMGVAEFTYIGITSFSILGFFLISIISWIIQGASEEIMVRGQMFQSMAIKWNTKIAIIVTSLLFSAMHLLNPNLNLIAVINIALVGFLFMFYALYEESLWGVCAYHSIWNFMQGNVVGSAVSGIEKEFSVFEMTTKGSELINGGEFGLEGSIITSIVLIISIIIVLILLKRKAKNYSYK